MITTPQLNTLQNENTPFLQTGSLLKALLDKPEPEWTKADLDQFIVAANKVCARIKVVMDGV